MDTDLRVVGMLMFFLIVCLWNVLRPGEGKSWQRSLLECLAWCGAISLPVLLATVLCIQWRADGTFTKVAQSLSGLFGMILMAYLIDFIPDSQNKPEENEQRPASGTQ